MPPKTIFERIISKEIPARIVYEDELAVAFLDAHPNHKGHTLVVPKVPYPDLSAVSDNVAAHLLPLARDVANAVKEATGADGTNIVMNNGAAAGQIVFHCHIHVIPRKNNDAGYLGLHINYASDAEADEYAAKIRSEIEKIRKA